MCTDSDCCSSFESSSTISNISDQEIIENDVLEILPDKDYKTRSLSKDLLVSPMDIEDYKEPEEDINLLGRRKLNWVEISEIMDFSKKNKLLNWNFTTIQKLNLKKYQNIHETLKDELTPFKTFSLFFTDKWWQYMSDQTNSYAFQTLSRDDKTDSLYKIRPFLIHVYLLWSYYYKFSQLLTIDEYMIKFNGRLGFR